VSRTSGRWRTRRGPSPRWPARWSGMRADRAEAQLHSGQPDAGRLRAHEVVPAGQARDGEGGGDVVGETVRPAVPSGPRERDEFLAGRRGQLGLGGPAPQKPQHGRRAEVVPGQRQGGRERDLQVGPQPVEQPALVPCGPLVVAGEPPHLPADLIVRNQWLACGVRVQSDQAADSGVLGVVLLARRAAASRRDRNLRTIPGEVRRNGVGGCPVEVVPGPVVAPGGAGGRRARRRPVRRAGTRRRRGPG